MNFNKYVVLHHMNVIKIWAVGSNRLAFIKIFDMEMWVRINKETYKKLYDLGIPTCQKLRYQKGNKQYENTILSRFNVLS